MRPIDADALKSKAQQAMLEVADTPLPNAYASKLAVKMGELFRKLIDDEPTVGAEPVRHGRWEQSMSFVRCSECLVSWCVREKMSLIHIAKEDLKYCPNCGAKMDAEVEG